MSGLNRRRSALYWRTFGVAAAAAGLWLAAAPPFGGSPAESTRSQTLQTRENIAFASAHDEPSSEAPQAAATRTSGTDAGLPTEPPPGQQTEPGPQPSEPRALTRAEEFNSFQRHFQQLDALREKGVREARLEGEVRDAIAELVEKEPDIVGGKILAVQCGGGMCRIDAQHDTQRRGRAFILRLLRELGGILPGGGQAFVSPDEHWSATYMARAGSELPPRPDRVMHTALPEPGL